MDKSQKKLRSETILLFYATDFILLSIIKTNFRL